MSTVNEPLTPPTPLAANLVSPVVGAVPTTTVGAPAGSNDQDNKKKMGGSKFKFVAPLLLLLFLVVGGGVAFFLSQQNQDIQNQASALTSKGTVEAVTCSQITGWACDSADYSKPLKIAVYYDEFKQENLVLVADANVNRADAAASCGGTTAHGFVIDIPADKIPAGQHQLIIKGIPLGAGNLLNTADMFDLQMAATANSTVSCGSSSQTCSVLFTASAAPASSIACVKDAFTDSISNTAGQYRYDTKATSYNPGDVVVFKITMKNTGEEVQQFSLSDVLIGDNLDQLEFMDTSCGTYNASTSTITASTNPVTGGDEVVCGFRVRIKSTITQPLMITNTANVTSGTLSASCNAPINVVIPGASPSPSPSPSPTPSVSPSPTPVVSPSPSPTPFTLVCGQSCTDTDQCVFHHVCNEGKCELSTCVNGTSCSDDMCRATSCGSTCSTTTDCPESHTCNGGVCKLTACVQGSANCAADSCTIVNPTPVISQPPTQTITQLQPSPAVGCNTACESNADCSNGSHICVDTATGRRCRLDSNVGSETCAAIGQAPSAPAPAPALPVAGSNDILKALGIGAISVILGIVGLLLL